MEAMEIVEWRMERLLCLSERERERERDEKRKENFWGAIYETLRGRERERKRKENKNLGVLCNCVTTWVRENKYIYIRVPSGNLRNIYIRVPSGNLCK
jgi:hypothetical protein